MANPYQSRLSANLQNESSWLSATTEPHDNPPTGTFHSRNATMQPLERQDLMIQGFSRKEISTAETELQKRKITPTYGAVSHHLDSSSRNDNSSLFNRFSRALDQTSGVQGKARLAKKIQDYADSLNMEVLKELNQHYASLWPNRRKIESIVDLWPDALKEQAQYIIRYWPTLVVKGDMKFNFSSTSDVCCNHYINSSTPLGYLAFFRLIKDIWFDALKTNNACTINRISHFLVSFTEEISDNTYLSSDDTTSRKEQFENVIQRELKKGLSSTYDIGAFAFMLVTYPPFWTDHNSQTLKLMVSRAFNSKADKLAPLYSQWQDPAHQDQVCKTVEAEVIPEVAITLHYLASIYNYVMSHRSKSYRGRESLGKEIALGNYFDRITKQLVSPIRAPDWSGIPPLPEIKAVLAEFYANPSHQKLFLGTEEFKAYQKQQKRIKARQRFTSAIKTTIHRLRKDKAELVKKQFKAQGFAAIRDNLGNISYGEAYYKERKRYTSHLKEQKLAVEQQIGVPIPFKATAAQLDQILDVFDELPIAEQRYWRMSRAYAESNAIPELLADLTLTVEPELHETLADEHENLKDRQSKFITCRCSECIICEASRYLCECQDGLNQRIAKRENRHRDSILKQKIVKSIAAHYAKNFCTAGTPVPEKVGQTATPSAQAMTQNPDIRRRKRRLKFRAYRDNRTLSQSAKMPRLEHVLTSGNQCEKKHRPKSVIDKYQRQLVTKVLHKKIYSPVKWEQRHRREAEPAGLRKYNKVLRKLYKTHSDNASPRLSTDEILDWFYKNPEHAANAVDQLQSKPQEIRSLFESGSLEFEEPMSLKAIPCQRIYHNIESFNKHLSDLAAGKDNNFVPLSSKKVKGLYLHKTFCLACRTNFGQKRELKAHIKATHQATMEKTFEGIRAATEHEPISGPASAASVDSPFLNIGPHQTFESIPFDQQSQAIAALFEHESV